MILAAVAVMMLVIWIGMNVIAQFVSGNEYQVAVDASTEIYKRAKLLSLGYDGSSDSFSISIPPGYAIQVEDGSVVALGSYSEEQSGNSTELTERMVIRGVAIVSGNAVLGPGDYELTLIYSKKDASVAISWD